MAPTFSPRATNGLRPLAYVLLAVVAFHSGWAKAQGASGLLGLGTLGGADSNAFGVSANGTVVVGHSRPAAGFPHAFRWTNAGMVDLGTLGGGESGAFGVSADGSVVVGYSFTAGNTEIHPFRWVNNSMTDLGTLGGSWAYAYAVSGDGATVVGNGFLPGDANSHAFRWNSNVMTDIGTLGGANSEARGVSSNGSVVVGFADTAGGNVRAFRWIGNVMTDIGTLGGVDSQAFGVSGDGSIVVGAAKTAGGTNHAFRWVSNTMTDLGTLGGVASSANAVSTDGSVVVGSSQNVAAASRAFRWTAGGGMEDVANWLGNAGVVLPGWTLTDATGVSSDGSVVVGIGLNGANNEAWLARVSPLGSGIINPTVFNESIVEAGTRSVEAGLTLPNLALFGAHHRSLLSTGVMHEENGICAWAVADTARYKTSRSLTELSEAGVCRDVGRIRVGIGMGLAGTKQDWNLGGSARYSGQYLIGEVVGVDGSGIEASLTGYHGRFGTELRRNYSNGGAIDTSKGTPNAESTAVRLRLDWKSLLNWGGMEITPYTAFSWLQTTLNPYTETGGGFPAAYDETRWTSRDVRLGASWKTALSASTSVHMAIEMAHRLDSSTQGVNGQVLGLWSFSLPGHQVKQNWTRLTVDFDHRLSERSAITVGVNVGTGGKDPSSGLTVGWKHAI